jgi:hypothetical protein
MHRRLLLLCLVASAACGGVKVRISASPGAPIPARVVAVYPFGLRWKAPAYRAYELAMDEVGGVLAGGTLGAIGPSEFQVRNYESDALFASTSLAGSLAHWGLRPDNVLALRGWAERNEATDSSVLYDSAGKPVGRRQNADVKLLIHEELLGPGGMIAEAWAEVPSDPFADHPSFDPDPELRRWVGKLTRSVLAAAADRLQTVAQVTDTGIDMTLDPRDEESLALPDRPPFSELLAQAQPIDREALLADRLLYFRPDLPPAQIAQLEQLPQGLLVNAVRGEASSRAGLAPGDFVVAVEGDPAAGEQTLRRWLSSAVPGQAVAVTVLRAGKRVALALPAPSR